MRAPARITGGLSAAGLVLVACAPAAIADDPPAPGPGLVELSADGITWGASLTALFDDGRLWVPGDAETASLFARNLGPGPADVRVAVESTATGGHPDLAGIGALRFAARVADGPWRPLAGGGLVNKLPLAPGDARRLQIRARFDAAAANQSQDARAELSFAVILQDAAASPGEDAGPGEAGGHPGGGREPDRSGPDGPGRGPSWLPGTGAPRLGLPLAVAVALVGAGLALATRRSGRGAASGRREAADG